MPDPFQNPNPLDPSKVKLTTRCGHGRTVYHDEPCPWCERDEAQARERIADRNARHADEARRILRDDLRTARLRATNNGQDRDNLRRRVEQLEGALERYADELQAALDGEAWGDDFEIAVTLVMNGMREALASTPQPSEGEEGTG